MQKKLASSNVQIITIGYGPLVTPEELRATVTGPLKDNLLIYSQASQVWFIFMPEKISIPLRLRKAGRVWCGGARETH